MFTLGLIMFMGGMAILPPLAVGFIAWFIAVQAGCDDRRSLSIALVSGASALFIAIAVLARL